MSSSLLSTLPAEFVWNFSQVFGERVETQINEADIITAVEFNHEGSFLATGDRGGRVVLFQRKPSASVGDDFEFYTEFQSHEPEFDYLKSLEIEEKINQIKWLTRKHDSHLLLSSNDKTIKLWKVFERNVSMSAESCLPEGVGDDLSAIRFPRSQKTIQPDAKVKRVFGNAHAYHINSISPACDDETFISADDLRINIWNLEVSDQSFNVVDMKPEVMEQLSEVITSAQCHPSHGHLFAYSTSKGNVCMGDMRRSALCDSHAKFFPSSACSPIDKTFLSEILTSVSDVKFSRDGRYFLTRDFLTVRVWDVNMESQPVESFEVHDELRPKLCDLYENDCVFDKFEATFSHDDRQILTGSYNNHFRLCKRGTRETVVLEAARDAIDGPRHVLFPKRVHAGDPPRLPRPTRADAFANTMDFNQKILHAAWHPHAPLLAVAAVHNLFLFRQDAVLKR